MPQFLIGNYETIAGQQFDGSTSYIEFGAAPPSAIEQSTLCLMYPTGTSASGNGALWSRRNAGNTDGQAFTIANVSGSYLDFVGSSATAARPFSVDNGTGMSQISFNTWQHVAATWTGNPAPGNSYIVLYRGVNGRALSAGVVGTTANGTAPANDSGAYNFRIGAYAATSNNFKGTIAYVARWNRALTLGELLQAQRLGPLSVPGGLILCWMNGRDYGPYAIKPTKQLGVTAGLSPPFGQRVLVRPFRKQYVVGGASLPSGSSNRWFLTQ